MSDPIGLERREKVMTFDEWWPSYYQGGNKWHSDCAKAAWEHQQQAIDALSLEWAKQQARIEALEKAARTLLSAIKNGLSHDEDEAIAELEVLLQEPTP